MQIEGIRVHLQIGFLTHDEQLIGVCDLKGNAKNRHRNLLFYNIGAESLESSKQRDMIIQDCEFAYDYDYYAGVHRFLIGDYFPVAVALIYNSCPKVIQAISLDGGH